MQASTNRRDFFKATGASAVAAGLVGSGALVSSTLALSLVIVGSGMSQSQSAESDDKNGSKLSDTYSLFVDEDGNISRLTDFAAKWAHIGSVAAGSKKEADVGSVHSAYTQPEALLAYQKTGRFPDGAVLIKEVRHAKISELPTGRVAWQADVDVWFVMIKDTQGRFKENPHWGDGWGWALYEAKEPEKNVSEGYKQSCIDCHTPVEKTDWIHKEIYPGLQSK